jgi:fatty acid desaturase
MMSDNLKTDSKLILDFTSNYAILVLEKGGIFMVLFAVMFKVIVFALCAGAAIAVLVFVPLMIYAIPYCLWVGSQNTKGKHKDKKDEAFKNTIRNATKLYKAKLSGREPIF